MPNGGMQTFLKWGVFKLKAILFTDGKLTTKEQHTPLNGGRMKPFEKPSINTYAIC